MISLFLFQANTIPGHFVNLCSIRGIHCEMRQVEICIIMDGYRFEELVLVFLRFSLLTTKLCVDLVITEC